MNSLDLHTIDACSSLVIGGDFNARAEEFKDFLSSLPVPDTKEDKPSDLYMKISSAIKDAANDTETVYPGRPQNYQRRNEPAMVRYEL
ncbi:unnamed protein product [Orchesella dallaii]|uniref:Endonuclease/exonuclease/phosphatase domain-containing protein n=1 Tax=Orchesella dallaii TaxID=48710 RepID=A0ABP1Q329_9HEXA